MNNNDNFIKYSKFRKEYPWFAYEKFSYIVNDNNLEITFNFNISDKHFFQPKLTIPIKKFFIKENLSEAILQNIIFHIGMIELLSYWKSTCSPEIIIKPFFLSGEQINWWKKLYFNGLGEFFYLNGIETNSDDFVHFTCQGSEHLKPLNIKLDDSTIIPVGGGKDSVVTLNLLSETEKNIRCLIINPRKATIETAGLAGHKMEDIIEIKRSIHPNLLDLNEKGFLNGHTPFSALLAFISILASVLSGSRNVALSNESSANEATVKDTNINHQYSKSFEFETDFRYYANKFILKDYNYYSFLRPLNELQIAKLFSHYDKYFPVFKSCNVNSKLDFWCCHCPKCLFTYIILSPFIPENVLIRIFGKNLLDSHELIHVFNKLVGIEDVKPFDCVGTLDEVNAAICMTVSDKDKSKLPYLLKYFVLSDKYLNCKGYYKNRFLMNIEAENFLKPEHINLIKHNLNITI